ncbi:MAG: sugar ABC transporter ATP-binding protein [Smithella sp.]
MSNEVILHAQNIEKSFSGVKVLKKVDLVIRRGEVHALMGENGAGKSVLIKIITGVYPKDDGEIFYNGKEVEINTRNDARKLGIAVIYQELSLIPTLSVMQNILLGQEISSIGILQNKKMNAKVLEIMKNFGLNLDPDAVVETLSIAQRQMVEILKALTFEASIIIMDEPTASLSSAESESLFTIINNLRNKGVAILYITHRLEEVYRLADRLTILRDGVNVKEVVKGEISPTEVIRLMIGKELTDTGNTAKMITSKNEVLLKVRNLTRKGVFYDISFDVHKGEILGIGGLVGSGRTELLRCIYGIDKYDSGSITYADEVVPNSVSKNIHNGFGLVPEDRRNQGFVPLLSVKRNIALTSYDQLNKGDFFVDSKGESIMCDNAIQKLEVRPNNPEIPVLNLSGGNQQKVVVGKWLMRDLKVLLIDELTVGIDVGVKDEIYSIIADLAKSGVVVIMVSSDLQELLRVSHRIIVLRNGHIFKEFNNGVITQEDILTAASGIETKEKVKFDV